MKNRYDSEQTVQDIINVSIKLFSEKGYEKTSIQDIVNGLNGLTRGAIYHHFNSKDDILVAVIHEIVMNSDYFNQFLNVEGRTAKEQLQALVIKAFSNYGQVSNDVGAEFLKKNPAILVEIFKLTVNQIAPKVEMLLESGNADGSLTIKNPKQVAQVMVLLGDTWFSSAMFEDTSANFNVKIDVLIDALNGLGVTIFDEATIKALKR
ncbi:TetR/AcrR family transcriptional regulator [Erysipelothrix sp. HDW6B]|uniref:TetR/AcrR family transcriptional regulator n=1 Tax=Erysipelothrix sp. HDW6B TaxID=2714929 RepID=UPI001409AD58|nr:TetR/AcrR family transcriptional regulator [Erysipelothrix sp. HDW6B]QIK86257.1 TetR/AcrR family transcriptional regulator [Erysipelothrix sp. HDW6B]